MHIEQLHVSQDDYITGRELTNEREESLITQGYSSTMILL